jgi:hypothetical protein
VGLRTGGMDGRLAAWVGVAAIGTLAGFLAFQAALSTGGAIPAISLMNALAAVVALACGALAFTESLGHDPAQLLLHLLAIALVLGCVPALAAAQAEMTQPGPGRLLGSRANPVAPAPGYRSG